MLPMISESISGNPVLFSLEEKEDGHAGSAQQGNTEVVIHSKRQHLGDGSHENAC